jgi:hypothetical protein
VVDLLPGVPTDVAQVDFLGLRMEREPDGLRTPYCQTLDRQEFVPSWNGLSDGADPSGLMRRIFPFGLLRSWA